MRAVSPAAANLQFDRLLSDVPTPNSDVFYTVPDVQPNPPVWSDWCNTPGEYSSGQAVCDARRASMNLPDKLTYIELLLLGTSGNGEGLRGKCSVLDSPIYDRMGWPQLWRSCPSGYGLTGMVEFNRCGGDHPPEAGGPNLSCINSLTVTISVLPTSACPIEPLTPLPSKAADPDTYAFEYEGKQVDISRLNADMKAALVCLTQKTGKAASSYVSSAWRPPTYQAHFQEVWEKWQLLKKQKGEDRVACKALHDEVKKEIDKHGIGGAARSPADRNGPHPRRVAFDVNTWFIPSVDTFSADCKVYRPYKIDDKWHVIHR